MRRRGCIAGLTIALLLLLACGVGLLLGWRALRQHSFRQANPISSTAGIEALERVRLGDVDQTIQIRGRDRKNPLLLVLHGGPGIPTMPFEYVNAELEKNFTIVEWDQRGAGKSFLPDVPPDSLNIAQLVRDAEELIALLRTRFAQPRIFIMAHSTGTVIGILVARGHPEFVRAYIGISQVVDLRASERILYEFAVKSAAVKQNSTATEQLRAIGPPPFSNLPQLQVSQKWVNHFAPDRFGAVAPARLKLLFFSPACTLADLWRMIAGAKLSFAHLWREFFDVDLAREVPRLEVPVYFLQGRNDHVVTAELPPRYFEMLEAPRGKQFIWFEHSAHWPQFEEPEKFRRVLIETVLAQNSL